MTTTREGRTFCDACLPQYFWNRIDYEEESTCVECCERCEDSCEIDDDCIHCDKNGSTLLYLDLRRGWWRASRESSKVYPCVLDGCRGGNGSLCTDGHTGALCGACTDKYDFDVAKNKCVQCSSNLLLRAGNMLVLLIFIGILIAIVMSAPCHHGRSLSKHLFDIFLDELDLPGRDEADTKEPEEDPRAQKREKLRKSLLTKLKIIIAALQIAASADSILFQVHFPKIFTIVTHISGLLGFAIFDVGSFKCLFRWTYFDKLLAVTLTPFAIVPLGAGIYLGIQRWRGHDRAKAKSRILYATLLFVFIILPSISTSVITYFSCPAFDRGHEKLRVIATQLDIKCTSRRYRRWGIFTGLMIAVWPLGATTGLATLLWSHRTKLNPDVSKKFTRKERKERRAYEIEKLRLRNADPTISGLAFLFEEYECRCYWFPVFEIFRRLFLSSALALFYPGRLQQVLVGLLGSMASYVVYSYHDAFVDHDDNVVAAVAQGELVLIYFSALAVYAADAADQGRAAFSGHAFGVVLVIVYFTSFLVAAYILILDLFGYSSLVASYDSSLKLPKFSFRSGLLVATTRTTSSGVSSPSVPPNVVTRPPQEIELV